jgi:hypothetical protein
MTIKILEAPAEKSCNDPHPVWLIFPDRSFLVCANCRYELIEMRIFASQKHYIHGHPIPPAEVIK